MAKVKAKLTKEEFDALPDSLKELYVDTGDGKTFKLDSDHEDVQGLKNSVAAARREREDAEKKLREYQQLGDPMKIAQAMTDLANAQKRESEVIAEKDRQLDSLKQSHGQAMAQKDQLLSQRQADIDRLVIDREVMQVLSLPDVQGNSKVLLDPLRKRLQSSRDERGEYTVTVLGNDGKPMFVEGNAATVKHLALEFRKDPDYAPLFKSTATGGGGTPSNGAAAGGGGAGSPRTVSATDKDALAANFDAIAKGEVTVT